MSTLDCFSPTPSSSSFLLLLPFLFSVLAPSHVCRAADIPEDATSEFSVRLYQHLQAAGEQDNIIFSPLSLAVALSMVELGARGRSLQEIRQVVGFTHQLPGEGHNHRVWGMTQIKLTLFIVNQYLIWSHYTSHKIRFHDSFSQNNSYISEISTKYNCDVMFFQVYNIYLLLQLISHDLHRGRYLPAPALDAAD